MPAAEGRSGIRLLLAKPGHGQQARRTPRPTRLSDVSALLDSRLMTPVTGRVRYFPAPWPSRLPRTATAAQLTGRIQAGTFDSAW